MKKYFKIWIQLTKNAFATIISNRLDSLGYMLGKLFRFVFFWLMIVSLFRFTNEVAGYDKFEILLFYATFNLIDVATQVFFRGVYSFKWDILKGGFDFVLSKPVNSLFMILCRLTDFLDMIFLLPITGLLIYSIANLGERLTLFNILVYLIFLVLGFLIALGLHIISACITMLTVESENFIWLYRDLLTFGRFPPEVYSQKIQFIFTYLMPIIIIVGFPSKAFLGKLPWPMMLVALVITAAFFGGSILLWKFSLKKYSSASS